MADINDILNITQQLGVNDHRFVGQSLSRNQRLFTSEISTVVPFEFTLTPHNYLRYQQNRGLLNSLRVADKSMEQYLNFSSTGYLNQFKYQGDMTPAQISLVLVSSISSGTNLVLSNLPIGLPIQYAVRIGDAIQVGRYTYYATADVTLSNSTTATVPIHRPLLNLLNSPVSAVIGEFGNTITLGLQSYVGITIPVILREYPTYSLVPYAANDFFIAWDGSFKAFENVLVGG